MPIPSDPRRGVSRVCSHPDGATTDMSATAAGDPNDSLSHLVSSPDRFAKLLGLTMEQVEERRASHEAAVERLQEKMASTTDGSMRHRLICQHRWDRGKDPFVCRKCFSFLPICCCADLAKRTKTALPVRNVVVWTHHDEWASPSNTGSLLPLLLQDTHIFMKGLHEENLQKLLHPDDGTVVQPIVLWPELPGNPSDKGKNNKDKNSTPPQKEIKRWDSTAFCDGSQSKDKIVLIAVEGTWDQARRMVRKLPYPRLAVSPTRSRGASSESSSYSWIEPLRRRCRGRDASTVCTARAVLLALEDTFGMKHDPFFEEAIRNKVDLTRRYEGKPYKEPRKKTQNN